jgi:hypothetical protein
MVDSLLGEQERKRRRGRWPNNGNEGSGKKYKNKPAAERSTAGSADATAAESAKSDSHQFGGAITLVDDEQRTSDPYYSAPRS